MFCFVGQNFVFVQENILFLILHLTDIIIGPVVKFSWANVVLCYSFDGIVELFVYSRFCLGLPGVLSNASVLFMKNLDPF